jgi:uncharacterized protein YdhG (YjbR/CyaY superfamily)
VTGAHEVAAYLAALPRPDHRAALEDLRARLKALLPDHIECLSYAMPGFRQSGPKGRMVAGYASFARNLGYYPHSGTVLGQIPDLIAGHKTTKGALAFTPETPLSDALLRALVTIRQAEIATTGR